MLASGCRVWNQRFQMSNLTRIKNLLSLLIGGSAQFRDNFIRLASASAGSQVIALATLPILTRLYTPTDFAVLAIFTAALAMSLSISTWRYEWILPNSKTIEEAAQYFIVSMGMSGVISIMILILIIFGHYSFPDNFAPIRNFEWILLLGILIGSLRSVLNSWMVYIGKLKWLANSIFVQTLITTVLSIVLALVFEATGKILVGSYVIGLGFGCLTIIVTQAASLRALFLVKLKGALSLAITQKKLAATSTLVSIMNALTYNMQIFLLSTLFGPAAAGQYSVTNRLSSAPVKLVSSAIANSFWSEATALSKSKPETMLPFYYAILKRLTAIAGLLIFFNIGLSFFIDDLLGGQWDGTAYYLLALLPYTVSVLIFGPTNHLTVYNKQIYQLLSDFFSFISSVIVMFYAAKFNLPVWLAIFLASIVIALGFGLRGYLHIRANREYCAALNKQYPILDI